MNALGWQIGAVLFGVSFLIIAIYLAKVLNNLNKVIEKTHRLIDINEKNITETVDNVEGITKNLNDIIDIISKITSILKIFKIFKK